MTDDVTPPPGRCPHCGRPPGLSASLTLDISSHPRILAEIRREIASTLREQAEGEPEVVREWAEQIAAGVEAGLREE